MYAGKIYLVANEYGIGINNAGEIGAQEAELEIQTQGDLLNSGTISSIGKLDAEVDGDLINRGIVSAKKTLLQPHKVRSITMVILALNLHLTLPQTFSRTASWQPLQQ
ncbi:MAG: hypothetical protein GWO81_01195 [Verrucomicrobia bacterium]|nr:hypothetical protein [Verrucomicrobiota bacterium]